MAYRKVMYGAKYWGLSDYLYSSSRILVWLWYKVARMKINIILETRYGSVLLLDLHPGSTESLELGSFFQKGGALASFIGTQLWRFAWSRL